MKIPAQAKPSQTELAEHKQNRQVQKSDTVLLGVGGEMVVGVVADKQDEEEKSEEERERTPSKGYSGTRFSISACSARKHLSDLPTRDLPTDLPPPTDIGKPCYTTVPGYTFTS